MAFLMIPLVPLILGLTVKSGDAIAKRAAKNPSKYFTGEAFNNDPVDCKPGVWDTDWGPCTAECGGGIQVIKRRGDTLAKNGGGACPENAIYANCNMQRCPTDCEVSPYSIIPELPPGTIDWIGRNQGWTECDADACDMTGYQYNYRDTQYDIPGTDDGASCPPEYQSRTCSTSCPNPVDFVSKLGNDNFHSSTLSGSTLDIVMKQLHGKSPNDWAIYSFEFLYPADYSNQTLIMKYYTDYGFGMFNSVKRPDGKYTIMINKSGSSTIGISTLSKVYNGVYRGSNRQLVVGIDNQNDLVTIEFVPTPQDSAAGVPIEIVRYYRIDPYM